MTSAFAMPQQAYVYGSQAASSRHYSPVHGTSSAFSSSAHPDEDWTKISDLAERRRIQNRIAQRNYRKKLKRRLEDLERRAGSSDEGEPEKKTQSASASSRPKRRSMSKAQKSSISGPSPSCSAPKRLSSSHGHFTPPMDNNDDAVLAPILYDGRERSHSPPLFPYPNYSTSDELLMDPYASTQSYPSMSVTDPYPNYITATTMPVTLPAMSSFSEAVKPSEHTLSPYLNYSFSSSVEMHGSSSYESSSAHNHTSPPLSNSYDTSTTCSEPAYEYPTTPLSMPGSPGLIRA